MTTTQRGMAPKDPTYRQSVIITYKASPIDCQDQKLRRICVLDKVSISFEIQIYDILYINFKINRAQFVWTNMSWILIWSLCHVCTFIIINVQNNGSEGRMNVQIVELVFITMAL